VNTQDPQWRQPRQDYPPAGYPQSGYPPAGAPNNAPYGTPYGTPYNQQYAQQPAAYRVAQPRVVKNPLATRALIYGIISFVLFVAVFFTNYIILATFGLYAIYYAIRGLALATRLPGHKGIIPSIFGLLLSVLSVLGTIGIIILNAMLSASH
jgi:hypothetical protein